MKVLLISGYKGSGKDTVASILKEYGFSQISFAKYLKDLVAKEYNLDRSLFDDESRKEMPLTNMPVTRKDSLSSWMQDPFRKEFKTLNNETKDRFDYVGSQLFGRNNDNTKESMMFWTPRSLLQFHGAVGRAIDSTHWVKKTFEVAKELTGNIVISDWRYESEYKDAVKLFGRENVSTLRVKRFESDSTQESERNLDNAKFDHIIENNGTIEDLYKKVKEIL